MLIILFDSGNRSRGLRLINDGVFNEKVLTNITPFFKRFFELA